MNRELRLKFEDPDAPQGVVGQYLTFARKWHAAESPVGHKILLFDENGRVIAEGRITMGTIIPGRTIANDTIVYEIQITTHLLGTELRRSLLRGLSQRIWVPQS